MWQWKHSDWCVYFSFFRSHISGTCEDDQVYIHAISDARCIFDMGVSTVILTVTLYFFYLASETCFTYLIVLSPAGRNGFQHEHLRHRRRIQWLWDPAGNGQHQLVFHALLGQTHWIQIQPCLDSLVLYLTRKLWSELLNNWEIRNSPWMDIDANILPCRLFLD